MKTFKYLAATVIAAFAATTTYGAAPNGPGPGGGCRPGAIVGSAECPAYGSGGCGGPRGERFAQRLSAADTNGDGMISRSEAQASMPGLAARFEQVDANGDGQVTPDEMQAARGAFRAAGGAQGWRKWDADGDGRLSRDEAAHAPRLAQEFTAIDTNADGYLTADEIQAAHRQAAGRGFGRRS